ncbi:DUF1707 and DUF4870 domain-containing protein [Spirillospora sp. CA-294931]|uniref:DUF1707 and DUF4870 domain-containing protein n=1 Tax=Spirillospora sp. CA-294931 TaxID=3240042 RepID=UPI003D8AAD67
MNTTGDLRVSNAEREPVIERLQQAFAEGRLDHGEFDMRMHLAMTAKTRGEMAAVLHDLEPLPTEPVKALAGEAPTGEDRMLAAAAHALGVPTLFLGPLLLMVLSGKRSEYVRRHAAEAVNFQLTILMVVILSFGVGSILYAITWIACGIAAVFALADRPVRYPWTLRLVK